MYKSPIELIIKDVQSKFNYEVEKSIIQKVVDYEIEIDKEELLKALKYDREQYNHGYFDGKNDAIRKLYEVINELNNGLYLGEENEWNYISNKRQ